MPPVIYATAWLTNNSLLLVPAAPGCMQGRMRDLTPQLSKLCSINLSKKEIGEDKGRHKNCILIDHINMFEHNLIIFLILQS